MKQYTYTINDFEFDNIYEVIQVLFDVKLPKTKGHWNALKYLGIDCNNYVKEFSFVINGMRVERFR